MPYTSDRPISIDGVRLDTLAWNIEKVNRAVAARRDASVDVPGRDGTLPSLNDSLEPASIGLEMFIMGTDQDGTVPPEGSRDRLWANLDELLHLFGTRHRLVEVWEQIGPGVQSVNMAPNPVFGVDVSGYSGNVATLARSTVRAYSGAASMLVTYTANSASGAGPRSTSIPVEAGHRYRYSAWVWVPTGVVNPILSVTATGGATGALVESAARTTSVKDAWQKITMTWDAATSGIPYFSITNATTATSGTSYHVGAYLVEEVPKTDPLGIYPTEVFSGATANDAAYSYIWQGAAHNSPSARVPIGTRRALAKVSDTIAPDVNLTGSAGRFNVALSLPYGVWEDVATQDWFTQANAFPGAGVPITIPTLTGATEVIKDAVVIVNGPATNPRVTDAATGAYIELQGALTSAQRWRVNVATWASRTGTTALTLDSLDTDGNDAQAITRYGGAPGQAAFLPLTPTRQGGSGLRSVVVTVTGTGITTASRILIRARRKYAL